MRLYRITLFIQTCYYFITALWPLVHIDSFMQVTGPKTDVWLVKTVAVLLLAISLSFLTGLMYKVYGLPLTTLAIISCIVLIIVDCFYVWTGTISKIYLLDALVETCLLALWLIVILRNGRQIASRS